MLSTSSTKCGARSPHSECLRALDSTCASSLRNLSKSTQPTASHLRERIPFPHMGNESARREIGNVINAILQLAVPDDTRATIRARLDPARLQSLGRGKANRARETVGGLLILLSRVRHRIECEIGERSPAATRGVCKHTPCDSQPHITHDCALVQSALQNILPPLLQTAYELADLWLHNRQSQSQSQCATDALNLGSVTCP